MKKENKAFAPIILFVFNRPEHAAKTIDSLAKNKLSKNTDLYIFCDGPRRESDLELVRKTRTIVNNTTGFNTVTHFFSEKNKGLGKSVIEGVSQIISIHGRAIVLEDDLETSPDFLQYMNAMLDSHVNNKRIFSIGGYTPPIDLDHIEQPIYAVPRICSWGWATWADRWNSVDWNISDYNSFIKNSVQKKRFSRAGKDMLDMLINQIEGSASAWAIRFDFNRFRSNDALTIYPKQSLIRNIGADGSGINTAQTSKFEVEIEGFNLCHELPDSLEEDTLITNRYRDFFGYSVKSRLIIILRRIGIYDFIKNMLK